MESAAFAVNSCGEEGKKAIAKEVAQIQQDLEFHSSEKVRSAGKKLAKTISVKAGIPKGNFEMEGMLIAGNQGFGQAQGRRTQLIKMKVGKAYTINVTGSEFNGFWILEHSGTTVAQGSRNNNAGMTFRPSSNGIYRIVVFSQRQGDSRFTLRVREE